MQSDNAYRRKCLDSLRYNGIARSLTNLPILAHRWGRRFWLFQHESSCVASGNACGKNNQFYLWPKARNSSRNVTTYAMLEFKPSDWLKLVAWLIKAIKLGSQRGMNLQWKVLYRTGFSPCCKFISRKKIALRSYAKIWAISWKLKDQAKFFGELNLFSE